MWRSIKQRTGRWRLQSELRRGQESCEGKIGGLGGCETWAGLLFGSVLSQRGAADLRNFESERGLGWG